MNDTIILVKEIYKILFFNTNMSYFLFLSKNVGVLVSLWLSAFLENPFLNNHS